MSYEFDTDIRARLTLEQRKLAANLASILEFKDVINTDYYCERIVERLLGEARNKGLGHIGVKGVLVATNYLEFNYISNTGKIGTIDIEYIGKKIINDI